MYKIIDIREKLPVNEERIANGGKIPKRTLPIKRIVIHCTADDDQSGEDVYSCARYDINPNHISLKGCYTITYAYYIEKVAKQIKIYHCVDHDVITWHVGKWNNDSLAIAVDKKGEDEAPEKYKAAVWLAAKLCGELGLTSKDVVFHRELKGTGWFWKNKKKVYRKSCPGWGWPDANQFREAVRAQLFKKSNKRLYEFLKCTFRRFKRFRN